MPLRVWLTQYPFYTVLSVPPTNRRPLSIMGVEVMFSRVLLSLDTFQVYPAASSAVDAGSPWSPGPIFPLGLSSKEVKIYNTKENECEGGNYLF